MISYLNYADNNIKLKIEYELVPKYNKKNINYFYFNPEIENNVFLLQPCDKLEEAVTICQEWNEKRINIYPTTNFINMDFVSFKLYMYENKYNFKIKEFIGEDTSSLNRNKIIVINDNENYKYFSLLS